jgi:hypothetical protein
MDRAPKEVKIIRDASLNEIPTAKNVPFFIPLLKLVWMSEKNAGPTIIARVSPKIMPSMIACIITASYYFLLL